MSRMESIIIFRKDGFMQAVAYEGFFIKGRFYVEDKVVHVPEKKRMVITIFDDALLSTSRDAQKKEILLGLYGSCQDKSLVEPLEVPMELELPPRYELA